MQNCERVVFISTISTELIDLAETLQQLRNNGITYHVREEVTGLLLYSEQYIFHCIESRHGGMDRLKHDLMAYPNYRHQKLIYEQAGVEPRFKRWSMVYAVTETHIQDFIQKQRWSTFNPYLLEGAVLDEFMELIYSYGNNQNTVVIQANDQVNSSHQLTQATLGNPKKTCGMLMIALGLLLGVIIYGLNYFGLMPDSYSKSW